MSHKQAKRNRKANPGPSKYELRRMQDNAMAKAVTLTTQDKLELTEKEQPRARALSSIEARMLLATLSAGLLIR